MELGRLVLRATVGSLFVGHGTQKLFGAFGGHGLEGTGGFFESLGLRPGKRHATTAGVAETAGGALLLLGALTPLSTSLISGTMVTAIRKVHARNGPWVTNNGFEYNVVLIAAMTALAEVGPGRPSVDAAAFGKLHGKGWAMLSLAAGVAGSYLVTDGPLNKPSSAPAPQEGAAPVAGDPAAADEGARFTREPVDAPSTTA